MFISFVMFWGFFLGGGFVVVGWGFLGGWVGVVLVLHFKEGKSSTSSSSFSFYR